MAVALKICYPPMHVIAAVCNAYFRAHGRLSHDKESMCFGDSKWCDCGRISSHTLSIVVKGAFYRSHTC